jgi:hypothetical protein
MSGFGTLDFSDEGIQRPGRELAETGPAAQKSPGARPRLLLRRGLREGSRTPRRLQGTLIATRIVHTHCTDIDGE